MLGSFSSQKLSTHIATHSLSPPVECGRIQSAKVKNFFSQDKDSLISETKRRGKKGP